MFQFILFAAGGGGPVPRLSAAVPLGDGLAGAWNEVLKIWNAHATWVVAGGVVVLVLVLGLLLGRKKRENETPRSKSRKVESRKASPDLAQNGAQFVFDQDSGPLHERRRQAAGITLTARYHRDYHSQPEMVDNLAERMLEAIAGFHGKGAGLADGVHVWFGWSMLTLRQHGQELLVCEPDFNADPTKDVIETVSTTLSIAILQTVVQHITHVEPVDCTCMDQIMLAKGVLSQRDLVVHRHEEPSEDNSGWYIGPLDPKEIERVEEERDYEWIPSYELIRRGRGHLLKVLALPPHYMALFRDHEVIGISDPENNELWPDPTRKKEVLASYDFSEAADDSARARGSSPANLNRANRDPLPSRAGSWLLLKACSKQLLFDPAAGPLHERRRQAGNFTLVARYHRNQFLWPDDLDKFVDEMLESFATLHRNGKTSFDGNRVVGWSSVFFRKRGSEVLMCEPDFRGDPANDLAEIVSTTVWTHCLQGVLHGITGAEQEECDWADPVCIAKGVLDRREFVLHRREARSKNSSGWHVAFSADRIEKKTDEDHVHAYELLRRGHGYVLPVLGLPPKHTVFFLDREIASIRDAAGRELWPLARDVSKQTIEELCETMRLYPNHAEVYSERGGAYYQMGDYERAIADFTEAIRLDPENAALYIDRGFNFEKTRDYLKAIADYQEAVRLDGTFANAYSNLAWVWATCPQDRVRNGKQAVECARKACALADWDDPNMLGTLAAAYAEAGQFQEAVKWLNKALEDPDYREENEGEALVWLEGYKKGQPCRCG